MAWTDRWIGLPYEDYGRGPDRYDCLGLFLDVQRDQFGREICDPVFGPGHPLDLAAVRAAGWQFRRALSPMPGHAALYRMGHSWHIATVVAHNLMLHVDRHRMSSLDPITAGRYGTRFEGFYEHFTDDRSRGA